MKRLVVLCSLLFVSPALAQAPGSAGFKTASEQREELIQKLRRDIAKVAHSVEVTKELIARSRGAPFLPDIYLRLAELYVEQARYEFYLVHEERGESSKGSAVAPTAKLLKEKAVETYQRILADFPDYEDNDKVLFFIGHEFRELGQYERMIAQYEKLVTKYPKSPLVLDAYLVLGDYRFDKQDLVGAKRYYQKILDSPNSSAHDMAHFKMAWVYLNEVDYKEALRHFEAAVKSDNDPAKAATRRERERLGSVKREALVDLAYAYTEVKKPQGALRYFRRLATSRNMYLLALKKLSRRYFVKQEFNAAAMVYREIARLSYAAEENLDYTTRIYEADKNAKNYRLVHRDVDAMLESLDDYRYDWRVPNAQRSAAATDFEVFTRDLSTKAQAWVLRAKKPRYGPRVAVAYTRYLESFPDSDHKKDIVENLADTLFEAKIYLRAGDRFEQAARLAEGDEKAREEALYNACVAFHEALKNAQKMKRFDRVWAQQGLIRNGVAYVESFPSSKKIPQIKLNIGRSHYEAGDFERAIGVFDEFIASYPNHPSAVTVADLILDSYAQTQDFAQLAEKARALSQVNGLGDGAFKNRMLVTAKRAEERQIGEVILTASVDRPAGSSAGEQLKEYWEANKNSPVAEKTLYTAFVQYKEARDFARTFETGNQFIGAYPQSQYLGDVFGTLASFTTQTGEYEQASVYLEEFYKRFPNDTSAQRMLAQGAQIKKLIGDHRAAIQAYSELLRSVRDPALRSEYASEMLDSYERLGDWDGLQKAARDVLRTDADNVKAHLMLGLVAQKAGDLDTALEGFSNAVRAAGRTPSESVQDDAARSAFMIGDIIYRQFTRISADGDLQEVAAAKAELLSELESALVDAVGYNQGEWAVAALHRAALAYADFASFLENAPVPQGLSPDEVEQYRQLLAEQAAQIRARADEFFDTCVTKARTLSVFTGAMLGCVNRTTEQPIPSVSQAAPPPPKQKKEELKQALTQNPKDLDALADLADYFLASGEPAKARLVSGRALDIDERDARFHNKIGMADLLLGQPQDAFFGFQRARDFGHPYAAANEIALRLSFGDDKGAQQVADKSNLDDVPGSAPDLHPGVGSALQRVSR